MKNRFLRMVSANDDQLVRYHCFYSWCYLVTYIWIKICTRLWPSCLMATSHHRNECWFIFKDVLLWYCAHELHPYQIFGGYTFEITGTSYRMSILRIWEKIGCIITASHCTKIATSVVATYSGWQMNPSNVQFTTIVVIWWPIILRMLLKQRGSDPFTNLDQL